jgi:hypothetical protein
MSQIFVLLAITLVISPASGFASVLTMGPGLHDVEGVKVSQEGKAAVDGRAYSLKEVGAGLRYKKVALFKARVYVGELLMDAPEKFQKNGDKALDSLGEQKAVAMRMTFLRDVDGAKVSDSFREALEENQVKLDSPAIKEFLEAVKSGGEAKEKATLIVIGEKLAGGREAVTFESSSGKASTVNGDSGLVRSVFSMWLGKIDDSGLEHLKKAILGEKD